MTQNEIFQLVNEKNKEIEKIMDVATFVLNSKIVELQNEISDLRKQCAHEFENGKCKYCGEKE